MLAHECTHRRMRCTNAHVDNREPRPSCPILPSPHANTRPPWPAPPPSVTATQCAPPAATCRTTCLAKKGTSRGVRQSSCVCSCRDRVRASARSTACMRCARECVGTTVVNHAAHVRERLLPCECARMRERLLPCECARMSVHPTPCLNPTPCLTSTGPRTCTCPSPRQPCAWSPHTNKRPLFVTAALKAACCTARLQPRGVKSSWLPLARMDSLRLSLPPLQPARGAERAMPPQATDAIVGSCGSERRWGRWRG